MCSLGCVESTAAAPTAEAEARGRALIRRAIEAHGAARLGAADVSFTFRGQRFSMRRKAGRFRYARGPEGREDVLTNDGYSVSRAGERVPAPAAAGSGVNSVIYFASLPYGLEDPAVRPAYVGTERVRGRTYEVVEVRFAKEGGGADHDDVFRYWIDADTGRLGLLAYLFHTGGGGVRLRVATGTVTAGGVTFVQWANHGVDGDPFEPALGSLPKLWAQGDLPELSNIVLEDVALEPL